MRRLFFLLVIFVCYSGFGQSVDYHTKKGFAAAGYDVVAYFDNEALAGSDSFVAVHDGVQYKFLTKENMEAFLAEPQAFIPQYGGYCAYAMAVSSKKVSVNPETFEIRDSKLYLFYNSGRNNTLQSWLAESPETLRDKADMNWDKVKNLRR